MKEIKWEKIKNNKVRYIKKVYNYLFSEKEKLQLSFEELQNKIKANEEDLNRMLFQEPTTRIKNNQGEN